LNVEPTPVGSLEACLHDQSKSGFFEGLAFLKGWLFSSQSGLFENYSDCCDWLDKSQPSKKATHFCFDHVNRLLMYFLLATQRYSTSQNF